MRCCCCNALLSDYEATRRSNATGDFLDMCNKCIKGLGIPTSDREDLEAFVSLQEDPDYADWGHLILLDSYEDFEE